jgi:uncharacterized protein (DUF1330 family)
MAAYVISEVEPLDRELFDRYRDLAQVSIEQHGGRYTVRAAIPEAAEGDWAPERRLVIVEFPDMDALRQWYSSESYAEALALRDQALRRRLLFVDGLLQLRRTFRTARNFGEKSSGTERSAPLDAAFQAPPALHRDELSASRPTVMRGTRAPTP